VLGTDTVPIDPPIPINSPQGAAFLVDLNKLTNEQRASLKKMLSSEHNVPVQEIEILLSKNGLGIPVKDCVMRHITQHQIELMRELFKQNVTKAYDGNITKDAVSEISWLSIMIITFILGDKWRTKNITDNLFTNEKRMDYLRLSLDTEQKRYEHQFRLHLLADGLFLLQNSEGFDLKIEELQKVSPTNPEVRLEDIVIELEIASTLVRSGHIIKFRACTGIQRQDFDIEIYFKKATKIFAEIKCKRDDTVVNVNNLRRTLYAAEKQLPTNNPSVVFVRIPTNWIRYENLAPEVNKVIHNYFRNIFHVNCVVFVWEEWIELQGNRRVSTLKSKLVLHPSPQYPLANLNELILSTQINSSSKGTFVELSFGKFTDK
jgi:hypothetical protein